MIHPQLRLHFIILLWGFTAILGKLISVDAIPLVAIRMFIAFLAIGLLLLVTGLGFRVSHRYLLYYSGVGILIGIHWLLFFKAIKISNVSVVLTTLSTGALFSAFLEPLFFKRKIRIHEIILALAIVICMSFIFNTTPKAYNQGIILGIACSFVASIFSVLNALLQHNGNPQKMMFYEMGSGSLFVFLFFIFSSGKLNEISPTFVDWIWLSLLGIIFTAYPMIESVKLFKYISPYTLTLSINLEPVYGIIFAYMIFKDSEKMSPLFYATTLVMLVILFINGFIQNQIKQNKKKKLLKG